MIPPGWLLGVLVVGGLPQDDGDQEWRDFAGRFCVECHSGGDKAEAGLDLAEPFRDQPWRLVRERLFLGEMPPQGSPVPTVAEEERVLAWLDRRLAAAGAVRPPAVPLRRLTRAEYEWVVLDLLGLDFPATERFPSDDVAAVFDNDGDVQSLSPLLLERYLEAAQELAAQAVHDPAEGPLGLARRSGEELDGAGSARPGEYSLHTTGAAGFELQGVEAGRYRLTAELFAQQAGPEVARAAWRVNGQVREVLEVPEVREAPGLHQVVTSLPAGTVRLEVSFENDYYRPEAPDPADRDRNLYVRSLAVDGPLDRPTRTPFERRWLPPEAPRDEALLADFLQRFLTRAYRGDLAAEELARHLAAIRDALPPEATFEARVRHGITLALLSPRFLFRAEKEPGPEQDARPLTGFELASRLSFFLWSSLPDETGLDRARRGVLHDPVALHGEVDRLLRDPRSSRLARRFVPQWLRIGELGRRRPDPTRFPDLDPGLFEAMEAESVLLFDAVLRERRPLTELVGADFLFVNESLARHYGIPGVRGDSLRRVPAPPLRQGGILTQASVLSATSNPTRTSPVKRGKWVLEVLLGRTVQPPPAGVESLAAAVSGSPRSLRERLLEHRARPECAVCHDRMDPLGFALEHFDALGRWRETEDGLPLDSSAVLPDGTRLEGHEDLVARLPSEAGFRRALVRSLFGYALGRTPVAADEAELDGILEHLAPDASLARVVHAVVASPSFLTRRREARERSAPAEHPGDRP